MNKIGVVGLLTLFLISVLLNIAWCPAAVAAAIWSFVWSLQGLATLWALSGLATFAYHIYQDGVDIRRYAFAELVYGLLILVSLGLLGVFITYWDYCDSRR